MSRVPPVLALALAAWPGTSLSAPVLTTSETPAPGLSYQLWVDDQGPVRLHVIEIDLLHPDIDLVTSTSEERGISVSQFATQSGAIVAINGDYFAASDYEPAGLARGRAKTWAGTRDDGLSGTLATVRDVSQIRTAIADPSQILMAAPDQSAGIISGRPLLVADGQALESFDCNDSQTLACVPAPRTAVAVSEDETTAWLVVVDGWQMESLGTTAAATAEFLANHLGSHRALMLDGGSASTMWLGDTLVSAPSDGVERPVANHLAITAGPPAMGALVGVVAERSVDGARLTGAEITFDDGRAATYDGTGIWQFETRPRYACARATLAGYHPAEECRHVPEGGQIYGSIVLWPEGQEPDGGAGPAPDSGAPGAGDAGIGSQSSSGCGCGLRGASSGTSGGQTAVNILLGLFVLGRCRSRIRRLRPRS